MYTIDTTFDIEYNFIHSWKKWDIDESFIECVWGERKDKVLIIKIKDIQSIQKK